MKKSFLLVVAVATALSLVLLPIQASADTSSDLEKARRNRSEIQRRLDRSVADYHAAEERLAVTQDKIAGAETKLKEAESTLARAQQATMTRANAIYRSGPTSAVRALFEADSFGDFVRRLAILERASTADSAIIIRAERARSETVELKAELEVRRNQEKEAVARLRSLTGDLSGLFRRAGEEEGRLQGALTAETRRRQEQERQRRLAASAGRGGRFNPGNFVCPVDGPNSFTDSWGDRRSGGRRHEGVDLFAARGTPVAAVVDGTLTVDSSSLGGKSLYLRGGDGHEYFYAHLDRYANISSGQRVAVGSHVAYVGNSGNARGGAYHLHFEIHPGGGRAINPYPTVRAACD